VYDTYLVLWKSRQKCGRTGDGENFLKWCMTLILCYGNPDRFHMGQMGFGIVENLWITLFWVGGCM